MAVHASSSSAASSSSPVSSPNTTVQSFDFELATNASPAALHEDRANRSFIISGNLPDNMVEPEVDLDDAFFVGDLTPTNSFCYQLNAAHQEIDDIFNNARVLGGDEYDSDIGSFHTANSQFPSRRPSKSSFCSIQSGICTRQGYDKQEFMRYKDPRAATIPANEQCHWHEAPVKAKLHPAGLFRQVESKFNFYSLNLN
jgi:hypothetical protein